ncbi:hypothetical protein EVAR_50420_1 [Eumeta japonica]|uniref:Uncharacterized protein n=1 Tax=Eumeta variegata TaxID=151549 RepID=A0A4C1WY68_EUMVA|nr:hypothetical protein EVAR_50420_1 [Eumeta japonica]
MNTNKESSPERCSADSVALQGLSGFKVGLITEIRKLPSRLGPAFFVLFARSLRVDNATPAASICKVALERPSYNSRTRFIYFGEQKNDDKSDLKELGSWSMV